ncbi:secretion system protein [Novosphingobium sp. FSY-8]|uniref:Secretion system protein n=1 Tax=Novosphingobium ovatum TaxID=1908523 RepID=A0ABW9XE26_9SPHN|nr:secretion system protein [Novosphingobium ovatum]
MVPHAATSAPARKVRARAAATVLAVPSHPAPPAAAGPAGAIEATNTMILAIGRGQLINLPTGMKDVFVADEKVADVQVKSNRQLYVYGRSSGETTIYASGPSGAVVWSANVRVGSNIDSVDQMLRVALPDAKVQIATIGGNTVLLTGTVRNPEDSAEATRLVTAYMGKEVNVISRIRTATPLQVNLMVRIAEVSRSFSKNLGVNLTSADSTSGFKFGIAQGRSFYPQYTPGGALGMGTATSSGNTTVSQLSGSTTLAAAGKLFGLDMLAALDAGETAGLVTTLAQPNLTALSGETAEFQAGGEIPIPLAGSLGTVGIEFKKYGVSLSYTPTVLADGRISLRVRPEVSDISSQNSVTLNGYTVPSLTVRRAETTVELGSGQSFMIAGLMQNNGSNSISKMPGVGDTPVLGALFKSTAFKKNETELVIIITPYLVQPVDDARIALPTDGFQNPDEVQRVLGNMLSDGRSGKQRPGPTQAPAPAPAIPAPAPGKVGAAAAAPGFSIQ